MQRWSGQFTKPTQGTTREWLFRLSWRLLSRVCLSRSKIYRIFIILAMIGFAYKKKSVKPRWLNTSLVMIAVIMIGYSSYGSQYDSLGSSAYHGSEFTSITVFSLQYYLNRQQYGDRLLLYGGGVYNAPMKLKSGRKYLHLRC